LNFGLATDQYPVEQAIRVAEVLLRHGANVNEKNAQGQSIFDVLAQAPDPSRIAPLMEMLTAASAGNLLALPSEQMAPSLGHVPIETLLANAEAQIRKGDYDRASTEADTAVTLFPGDARARALVERIRRIRSVLK
jgi:Flp pilus assembly protein TadD